MKSLSTYPRIAIVTLSLMAATFFASCQPSPVDPSGGAIHEFASLRVLNFTSSDVSAENCTAPIDVYFSRAGTIPDTLANVNNLQFGGASVYENNLKADPGGTVYNIDVRPVRSRDKRLIQESVTLLPGHRYSYVVYSDPASQTFSGKLVEDGAPTPPGDPKKVTYVRFMNVNPNSKLSATVNSLYGDHIAPAGGLNYKETAPYVALNSAMDTSYAFLVFDPVNPDSIVGKITYQSFAPGSYHTIVYAGDPCRTAPHYTSGNALDSMRVRVLDDNSLGNEETAPVPSSIRYFIVNAMIPGQSNHDDGMNQWWGFTVANDANPNHHGFTFDPSQSWKPVPSYGAIDGDGVQDVYFSSVTLSAWVQVKGFTVANANGDNPQVIFDVHAQRSNMVAENAYSIIFFDTIPGKKNDSSALGKTMTSVLVSDQPDPNKATLIFVNATAPSKKWTSTSAANIVSFYVNGNKVSFAGTLGKSVNATFDPSDLAITAKLGGSQGTTQIDAGSFTIHGAKAGEVYEVVLMGQRSDADFNSPYPSTIKVYHVGH